MSSSTALAAHVPDGVVVEPRRFEWRALDTIPKYWFGGNAVITHMENAFSLMIPPGEAFFIRSVRAYADQVQDPQLQELITGFVKQEGLHSRAHNEFNAALAQHGVDVEREVAYAKKAIARMERWLPKKMRLGATVFFEHGTAIGAHMLFAVPAVAAAIHPEALRFWRWHAAEELEHKAVAFDVYREVGGGYLLRVLSALAGMAILAIPFQRLFRRMLLGDPERVTGESRKRARAMSRRFAGMQVRMFLRYFRPGFHPWDEDDGPYLQQWYQNPDVAALPQSTAPATG